MMKQPPEPITSEQHEANKPRVMRYGDNSHAKLLARQLAHNFYAKRKTLTPFRDAEKAAECMTPLLVVLIEFIDDANRAGYECVAGPLVNNTRYRDLVDLIGMLPPGGSWDTKEFDVNDPPAATVDHPPLRPDENR